MALLIEHPYGIVVHGNRISHVCETHLHCSCCGVDHLTDDILETLEYRSHCFDCVNH